MTNETELKKELDVNGWTTEIGTCMTALMLARLLDEILKIRKEKENE